MASNCCKCFCLTFIISVVIRVLEWTLSVLESTFDSEMNSWCGF